MIETNIKTLSEIAERYYFSKIKEGFERKICEVGEIYVLNYLTKIMEDAKPEVEKLIQQRIKKSIISNAEQARKTIAGNGFQGLVAYSLIRLQVLKLF